MYSSNFYEDSEFINHYRQKNILYMFFFIWNFKVLSLLAFLSHSDYEKNTYFWKMPAQVCGKKYATPLPYTTSPHPSPPPYPPPQRQLPRANDIGPFGSCDLLGQWRCVLSESIGIRSIPFRAPPTLLPSAHKTGSSSGEKCLSLSEGLGKEYMKWRKTSIGKTGTQAEGRHVLVVIRASQG